MGDISRNINAKKYLRISIYYMQSNIMYIYNIWMVIFCKSLCWKNSDKQALKDASSYIIVITK